MLNMGPEITHNQTSAYLTEVKVTHTPNLFSQEIAKHLQRQEKAKAERRREKQLRRVQIFAERDEVRYCVLVYGRPRKKTYIKICTLNSGLYSVDYIIYSRLYIH
jgi:hypothetical protein